MSSMNGLFKVAVLALFAGICFSCQSSGNSTSNENVVSVPDLGFRYTPPTGMKDVTSPSSREARSHAASYTGNTLKLLLDLSSGGDDTVPDWHHVWIFTLPRAVWSTMTEPAAEGKMNSVAAGPRATAVGQPQSTAIAEHSFVVSEFEQKEPPLVKHAKIFTTVCKGQLVAFALVSNSEAQVSDMENSLKTLDFSSH
jgi:hypothetical protein